MSRPVGPYAPVRRAGGLLLCSGQIGVSGSALVPGGLAAELRQALANLKAVLEAEGSGLDRVVKATVMLADMADYAEMNRIWAEAFGDAPPARSAFAVAALPLGARVEVEAWALP